MKNIESNNKLKIRLEEKGYLLQDKVKEGRKVYYILEQINEYKEVYNNLLRNYYKTNKEKEFTMYFGLRTLNNDLFPLNKADISNKVNVSARTISNWDNTLIDKSIISKDGFYYFSINKETGEMKQCSKEEYNNFWRNKSYVKAFYDLQIKYINGQITLTELQLASAEMGSIITLVENKYYFRTKKYKTNTDNQLYIDTYNLISAIYGNDKEYKPYFEVIKDIDIKDLQLIKTIKLKKLNKNKYINLKIKKVINT